MSDTDWGSGVKHVAPELNADGFNCPNCGSFAHQSWGPIFVRIPNLGGTSVEAGQVNAADSVWRVAKCQRCNDGSIWLHDRLIWPQRGLAVQPHPDMPEGERALFVEAAQVSVISRRAGAALARATVEQLIKSLDTGEKGTLNDRIGRLKGRISTGLFQMLDVVRFTGNELLHEREAGELVAIALDDDAGPALIQAFLECANRLVDELITRPAQDKTLWDKLPPSVAESILRRSERKV